MDVAIDKLTGRAIIHMDGSDSPEERLSKLKDAFTSDGWKPGGNVVISTTKDYYPTTNILALNEQVKLAKTVGVKKVGMTARDELARVTGNALAGLFKAQSIPFKYFDCLQDTLDWINED